jgi:prepilin-type N-terminal cleavage/methylation domain-containing protein
MIFRTCTWKKRRQLAGTQGFTLIELLVVLVLMSLLTLVFLERQQKFDSSTIMRSLAYSIALSLRQAQVYGISVRPTVPGSANFATSHGLFFQKTAPTNYILFSDQDNNHRFQGDPIEKTFALGGNFVISEFCAIYYNGATQVRRCSGADDSGGAPGSISMLNVIFVRPNPDAQIYALDASYNPIVGDPPYTYAYVQIKAIDGTKRGIHVWATGQISVDQLGEAI